jgi:hypothetical protein
MPLTDATPHLDAWLLLCDQSPGAGAPWALFLFGYALHHYRLSQHVPRPS